MIERTRPQPPPWIFFVFWGTLLALFLPLFVLIISSFQETDLSGNKSWTLHWYAEAFNDPVLLSALARSVGVALVSSLFATVLGMFAALTLSRWKTKGWQTLDALSTISLALPELVLALSLLSWFALMGFSLSLATVVIGHVTLSLPFASLVIGARMKALSPRFEDAARDLGASEFQIFSKINFPLLKPALLTSILLCFLISFDDFLVAFFMTGAGSDTLPVKLYTQMKAGLTPKLHALASITLCASLFLCWLLMRVRNRE